MSDTTDYIFESLVEFREPPQDTNLARELLNSFKRHSNRTLVVEALSGRQWTGSELLTHCSHIATCLLDRAAVKVNDVVMTLCDRDDSELMLALGILLAGASIYPTTPTDGYHEAQTLCELVRPQVIVINRRYQAVAERLCREVAGMSETRIVWFEGFGVAENGPPNECEPDENNNCDIETAGQKESVGGPAFRICLVDSAGAKNLDERKIELVVKEKIKSSDIVSFLLTSGSTGRPKVVPATHSESVASLYCMISAATNPLPAAKGSTTTDNNNNNNNNESPPKDDLLLPIGPDDVIAGDLPLDHGAGLNMMFLSLWMGAKYIVMPSFNTRVFWRAVNDYKISFSLASTAFCFQLLSQLKEELIKAKACGPDLSSLKTLSCCGAKLNFVELVDEIRSHFKHMTINQSYGCTENGFISNLARRDATKHLESVGYLLPGIRAKIIDPNTNKTLKPNERGELLIWSRSLFKGYRCHSEVDQNQIYRNCHDERGEFYRTGDQAHFDSEGRIHVHGRYKDTLVLFGDWKIMPAELEEVVDAHPLVEASAVVGVIDPELPSCHKPRAFVKLVRDLDHLTNGTKAEVKISDELAKRLAAQDHEYIADHIRRFVAERVAPAKQLTGGVRILEDFPRNGLLRKIDRKALRELP